MNMMHFGVGCFHFAPRKLGNLSISVEQYVAQVIKALEGVKSISDIDYDYDKDLTPPGTTFWLGKDEPMPDIAEGPGFLPAFDFWSLSFRIHIPLRVQLELSKPMGHTVRTGTDSFKVNMMPTFYHPVAFVECVKPKDKSSPSDGVFILRKYLEQEFAKNEALQFQFLGPAPFHADFDLQSATSKYVRVLTPERPFYCEVASQEGYDQVHFYYHSQSFKNESDAMEMLFDRISEELGLYYAGRALENQESNQWNALQKSSSEAFDIASQQGLGGLLGRLFRSGYLLRRAVSHIARMSTDVSFHDQFMKNSYSSTYASRRGGYLGQYIRNLLKEKTRYPLENISDGLRYIESNRNNLWQLIAILLSAVIGGICGGGWFPFYRSEA
jgi:hypothetical protein